ncbi:MAG: 4-hydroxy-3-methylbut-2-enyl diphosphate reductase [Deltaproteobacteria bacterium]|uniref:4-hydroxy-3-methylbut-2-enyl diphosphate reductase n=1 Tax=Desulfobacula sp. TaxID=2593537 RepID=UPI0019C1E39C|nr:4-hydroxy-3-methylbut-2-enyl diphosphate reductase [Candidatus Desulfobacula maris]MBL6993325.1 4-hydroxy-3-methylbut-2-enyl diphosphate reductase [Desulfobacula sp.]
MKIVVAKTAGFCMGVRRAVDMVLDASNLSQEPIYTYGPLIHNPQVLAMLEEKKIFRIDKIPEKGSGIVLIRAHGVPPEDEKALKHAGFMVINATCPRVVRVQVIIDEYAQKGYSTIIIGDEKHPEVVGLLGYAKGKGHTITTMEQLCTLPEYEAAVVVAQTTQDTVFYDEIKAWCKTNAPHYKIFDTICGSTEKRQAEIRKLAGENDAVIVVGGMQSGNTKRLAQIASGTGKLVTHIEDVSQIDYGKLSSARSVAITAGASTPNWIINDACREIENNLQHQHGVKAFLFFVRDFLLKTNIMAAAGAGFLTYACSILQGIARDFHHALIATLYILSMQILNNLFTIKSDKYNHPQRAVFYKKNKFYLWTLAILSGSAGLYLSFLAGALSFFILFVMSLLGLSYNLKIFSFKSKKGTVARIKDIPGSKTILITIAWGTVTCLLPAMANQSGLMSVTMVCLFAMGLVFARTAFFDILAIQGDRITGKETLPTLLGEKRSFEIIQYVLLVDMGIIIFTILTNVLAIKALFFAFIPLMMLLLIRFFKNNSLISGVHREFVIEFSFIATGLLAAVI